jgi:glycosyltransferase involved in cell wall biosynthesis
MVRSERSSVSGIERAGIVVPARNEAALLGRCVRALAASAEHTGASTTIVLVLDSCTDESAAVAAELARDRSVEIVVLPSAASCVGGARADGVRHLLTRFDPATLWIATTDADSIVPPHWIGGQLAHARDGADVVAGTVDVHDWTAWPPNLRAAYHAGYARPAATGGHGHIHGANLGVRASTYLQVGGFPRTRYDEDVHLVRRAAADGAVIAWATDIPVVTSSRPANRAPRGFGQFLHSVARTLDDTSEAISPADGLGAAPTQSSTRAARSRS